MSAAPVSRAASRAAVGHPKRVPWGMLGSAGGGVEPVGNRSGSPPVFGNTGMMSARDAVALRTATGSAMSSKPNAAPLDWAPLAVVVLDELALPAAALVLEPPLGTGCQDVPGLAITGSAVTVAPFISQIATVPSVFRHRISSEKPSPVKLPVPIAFHDVPGLAMTGSAVTVAPFISQIATEPSVFCHRMSA